MTETEHVDTSNMGRCDICGSPLDMRDSGDVLRTIRTEDGRREAFADALREFGAPPDAALADALEDGTATVHRTCYQRTEMSGWPSRVKSDSTGGAE